MIRSLRINRSKQAPVWLMAAAVGSALALAACGGHNDPAPPGPTEQVPASATSSVAGFIAYLTALVVFQDDTLQPVDLSNVPAAPTDDNALPTPLT